MKSLVHAARILALVLCLGAGTARASVIIGGTRVVFPASQGQTTVRLSNKGDQPALVEAWIDTGNIHSTPDSSKAPFLITPPLFRMEADKDQSLRILFTGNPKSLPADRESLFWLNVLEIPPKPKDAAGKNLLQFAVRSRLKLFYRPAKLAGNPLKAPDALTWTSSRGSHGAVLVVHNPTPYYITITRLSLKVDGKPVKAASGMVAPFGVQPLALSGVKHALPAGTSIAFTTINDYGAGDVHKGTVVAQ
ncbi:molecular chaperone [Oleiagrimonas sp.]|jgi:P pilus assembly chaperone PapD|uniref:fimbrial biogenesis chaperone n=1 Tax=Oleiagrimonas sp. TaxID=2010330 RepID=UPI0026226142|nr:molecular chaperone [Oleiagrimonas sp.]MDA3913130.1 molecular chaperone [Oleiagrimonas sp.]